MEMKREKVIDLTDEMLSSYELISTKVGCATTALSNIPSQLSEEDKKLYIQTTIEALGNYQWLEKDWWNNIFDVAGLPRFSEDLHFDSINKEIYHYVEAG